MAAKRKPKPIKRKPKPDPMLSIPTRLPGHLLDAVDAFVARFEGRHPGISLGRSEAVRMLLREGLVASRVAIREPKKGAR